MTQSLTKVSAGEHPEAGLIQQSELTPEDIVARINKIQTVMKEVMKKDHHYGVIEGCGDKPVLLKPGAEKLCLLFRLAPTYEVEARDLEGGHRDFMVTCELHHIPTGSFMGAGLGSCSTMESKYRFRSQRTGRLVPQEYWKHRDQALLGGPQFTTRKAKGKWEVIERIEHDNPADYYNTCLKQAKKRAHTDATLTATGASDIFAPGPEEEPEELEPQETPKSAEAPPKIGGLEEKDREIGVKLTAKMRGEGLDDDECRELYEWAREKKRLAPSYFLKNFRKYFDAWEQLRNPAEEIISEGEDSSMFP